MMSWARKVGELSSFFVGLIFLCASWPKLQFPYEFLSGVYSYEIVGRNEGLYMAAVLPWVECVLGACLLARFLVDGALILSSMLLTMFVGVQIWAISRGLSISCSCFGGGEGLVTYMTLIRTLLLLILCLFSLYAFNATALFQRGALGNTQDAANAAECARPKDRAQGDVCPTAE